MIIGYGYMLGYVLSHIVWAPQEVEYVVCQPVGMSVVPSLYLHLQVSLSHVQLSY